ncbi:DUF3365 domain-containing protein [Neorhodopirellula pilleata]|uniref:DUF3365 domain-containing protein n=1 Tax=Neorhodopirellula pilleata TaxID=2714738 RepID=A0A5C6AD73_9BACT|nr:DUF3365 domain-containing protein [Neorhodopirellula pilleata]TWT97356.1 hypothetical protein Pla100_25080 [Neorhodopirellula pilleata]
MKPRKFALYGLITLILVSAPSSLIAQEARWGSFSDMHDFYTDMFVSSAGFGPTRLVSPQEASIRREELHRDIGTPALRVAGNALEITNQSLIGLDRESPIVFQTTNAGMMRRMRIESYQTREPNEFEQQAIQKMKNGQTVTYRVHEDRLGYTVYGALRAMQTCAKCHDVPQGTLLGAFIFELKQINEKVAKAD